MRILKNLWHQCQTFLPVGDGAEPLERDRCAVSFPGASDEWLVDLFVLSHRRFVFISLGLVAAGDGTWCYRYCMPLVPSDATFFYCYILSSECDIVSVLVSRAGRAADLRVLGAQRVCGRVAAAAVLAGLRLSGGRGGCGSGYELCGPCGPLLSHRCPFLLLLALFLRTSSSARVCGCPGLRGGLHGDGRAARQLRHIQRALVRQRYISQLSYAGIT